MAMLVMKMSLIVHSKHQKSINLVQNYTKCEDYYYYVVVVGVVAMIADVVAVVKLYHYHRSMYLIHMDLVMI